MGGKWLFDDLLEGGSRGVKIERDPTSSIGDHQIARDGEQV